MMERVWNCGVAASSVGMEELSGIFCSGTARASLSEQINYKNRQNRLNRVPVTGKRETYIVNQRIKHQQADKQEHSVHPVANGEEETAESQQ